VPFELWVALRYLRDGRMQTALILAGTTVGVAVLVFLTALIGGLQRSLVEGTLSAQAHVLVKAPERAPRVLPAPPGTALVAAVEKPPDRVRSIEGWQEVLAAVRRVPGVVAATPTAAGSAFASRGEASRAVALRGIVPESFDRVIALSPKVKAGRFGVAGAEAVIGVQLAADLGLAPGDKLRIATPEGRAQVFTVSGLFDLGNKDVNQRWVLVPLHAAQTLLDLTGGATALELRVAEPFGAERTAQEVARRTGLAAESWMRINAQLLTNLRAQSSSSLLIQALVVVAVALGIASVLGVSVLQKAREIGIMKAYGTRTGAVLRIYVWQGAVVGAAGALLGGALGAGMAHLFVTFARAPDGAPLFPVEVGPGLYAAGAAVALATGLVSSALPARHAASLDPAVVIRHG
jgi:lipoprotein-releasing system permease protein